MWRILGFVAAISVLSSPPTGFAIAAEEDASPAAAIWEADGAPGTFAHEFARRLYHDSLPAARDFAEANAAAEGDAARFALGATLFFGAVEGLVSDLSRHGLLNHPGLDIPFLRLPVPRNPAPAPIDYAGFRAVLQRFVDRVAEAEPVLTGVADPAMSLPLRPFLVRLDLDGDGAYDVHERAFPVFFTVLFGPWGPDAAAQEAMWREFEAERLRGDRAWLVDDPVFGFDTADAAWLAGYCRLLSAMVEIMLAHDWEDSFNQSFHLFFPQSDLPYAELAKTYLKERESVGGFASVSETAMILDLISFAVHSPWEVAEPERLLAARGHLKAMIAASRRSWTMILAETDNLNAQGAPEAPPEWIPAPAQLQADDRRRVTPEVVEGWRRFLDEFERMLDGELLIPHWRFDQGLNVRRLFEEPRPMSPILMMQGADALPYLEDGPVADSAHMDEIMGLLGGDFLDYFIWFN